MAYSSEYTIWLNMIQRCTNPNTAMFEYYGGRGITVCSRWMDSFEAFYADMGPRPGPDYSVERQNGNGNYEPGNCIWATREVQANNRSNNVRCVIDGQSQTVAQIARQHDVKSNALRYRLGKGMSIDEALEDLR